MIRQILFTIDMKQTNNARQLCENESGKQYHSVEEFINTLIQYELIESDREVVIYELWEFCKEFNTFPTGKIDDDTMRDHYIGHLLIGDARE